MVEAVRLFTGFVYADLALATRIFDMTFVPLLALPDAGGAWHGKLPADGRPGGCFSAGKVGTLTG